MRNRRIFIALTICIFILICIYYNWHNNYLLKNEGLYTIGVIDNIHTGGKGCGKQFRLTFFYRNVKQQIIDICESELYIAGLNNNDRVFIKFIPNSTAKVKIFYKSPIVNDTLIAPVDGWSDSDMKKIIPGWDSLKVSQ